MSFDRYLESHSGRAVGSKHLQQICRLNEHRYFKREGRLRTGYHIHLGDVARQEATKTEVTLFHEKTYSPHRFSETVILDNKKKWRATHTPTA